jgi:hypothetical protein
MMSFPGMHKDNMPSFELPSIGNTMVDFVVEGHTLSFCLERGRRLDVSPGIKFKTQCLTWSEELHGTFIREIWYSGI